LSTAPTGKDPENDMLYGLKEKPGCVFCEIGAKRTPATIYFETEFAMAIKDIKSDDILLIPKKHIECTPKNLAMAASLLLQLPVMMKLDKFEVVTHIGWHVTINHLHIRIRRKDNVKKFWE